MNFIIFRPVIPKQCKFCEKVFISVRERNKHTKKDHKEYECEKCGKIFTKYNNYRRHYNHHATTCEICDKQFYSLLNYQTHLVSHLEAMDQQAQEAHSPAPSPAPFEGIDFSDDVSQPVGYTIRVPCPKCPLVLESEKEFIIHMARHGMTYDCDFCGEHVKEWSNIRMHIQMHLGPGHEDKKICEC
jgi:uncharacterized C2H2 Zn-finger protein